MIRPMKPSPFVEIEEVTDFNEIAASLEQDERHQQNSDWLASHWHEFLPQAREDSLPSRGRLDMFPNLPRRLGNGPPALIPRTMGRSFSLSFKRRVREFMRIAGEWYECDDGIVRPIVRAAVAARDSTYTSERMLIDTGADCTVLSASLMLRLGYSDSPPLKAGELGGIGGRAESVTDVTAIKLTDVEGRVMRIRGEFAAFTDPKATNLSILGRDILDLCDVIVSRRKQTILLLFGEDGYATSTS